MKFREQFNRGSWMKFERRVRVVQDSFYACMEFF